MKLFTITLVLIISFSVTAFGEAPSSEAPQEAASLDSGSISGRAMINAKKPMDSGIVLLFNEALGPPPHPYKYWRIPDIINGTDKKGNFSVVVPQGTYYMMIAKKSPDGEIGPPKKSEFLYFHGDSKGNPKPIVVSAGAKLNLGLLNKSFVWSPKMVMEAKDITAVEGVVASIEGKPVGGAIVFAYLNPAAVGRPAFVSDRTDKTGKYQLRVYEGGTYYLKVRSVIGGGAPEAGEYQSATKEFVPVEVNLKKGEKLKDVALKVAAFSGKGSTGTEKPAKVWKNTGSLQAQ
jgi:hypothetical protein